MSLFDLLIGQKYIFFLNFLNETVMTKPVPGKFVLLRQCYYCANKIPLLAPNSVPSDTNHSKTYQRLFYVLLFTLYFFYSSGNVCLFDYCKGYLEPKAKVFFITYNYLG